MRYAWKHHHPNSLQSPHKQLANRMLVDPPSDPHSISAPAQTEAEMNELPSETSSDFELGLLPRTTLNLQLDAYGYSCDAWFLNIPHIQSKIQTARKLGVETSH